MKWERGMLCISVVYILAMAYAKWIYITALVLS